MTRDRRLAATDQESARGCRGMVVRDISYVQGYRRALAPWVTMAGVFLSTVAAGAVPWDVLSDTWVARDALGRKLPEYVSCGPPRAGKTVGIFYFLWHGQHGTGGPHDITRILEENPDDPPWGPVQAFHHWGEPELGYYLADDEFVIRKHAQALTDAGVDTLIFDVTNGYPYLDKVLTLCRVYQEIRDAGGATPQFCFIAYNGDYAGVVQQLYDAIYAKNLHPELWFRWQDKPLILCPPDGHSPAVRAFFTLRTSWAWSHANGWFGDGHHKWPWLDNYPQAFGWDQPGVPEAMPVCAAQHATTNIGRSFRDKTQPERLLTDYGVCFAEQWRRVLDVDPAFLFITGWNEWVAQRFLSDGKQDFLGKTLPEGQTFFVDQYNQEYSRDIEPMRDGHTDNYYYQMAANIRRFKGVRQPEAPSPPKAIAIDGDFGDWADVKPEFRDTLGDVQHRDHPGWGAAGTYVNTTGRNDFAALKVARDEEHVYFYARCQEPLTPATDPQWMMLFIDTDRNQASGWEGYDLVVNRRVLDDKMTVLECNAGPGHWRMTDTVPYRVQGTEIELALPRKAFSERLNFEFKWADNTQVDDNIAAFSVNGDSAPNRRFNYLYQSDDRPWEVQSDTWAATDALDRKVADFDTAGPVRPDKQIGIFYFLWLGQHGAAGPHDITRILEAHPDAMQTPTSPPWGALHAPHHWGESLFGYYLGSDPYVLRKHAQMLTDAGVDAVIFDVTNQLTYPESYRALMQAFEEVRANGGDTPQVAFLTPFWDPPRVVQTLYEDLYRPGLHAELWYRWKGKPLILADPEGFDGEIRGFFTFRKPIPGYLTGPSGPNQWAWLQIYPQHAFPGDAVPEGAVEQMAVGIGQNAWGTHTPSAFSEANTYGRSWHDGAKDPAPDAVNWGYNVTEQWERALDVDPRFIFLTGWNEWIAGRFKEFNHVSEPVMFVDQFTQEYSRDIEPMKGGHSDVYYYQMASYNRRFKGMQPPASPAGVSPIAIDGDFGDWAAVQPAYRDDLGDTAHRNHPGWGAAGPYIDSTGRNDFAVCKVAFHDSHLCFYARTNTAISPHSEPHWMLLFLNTDRDRATGWEGYDFVVNRTVEGEDTTLLEHSAGAWNWESKVPLDYRVDGREIELAIPCEALGLDPAKLPPTLEFKWADNMQTADPLEFTRSGDTAPNNRFNYVVHWAGE